MPAQSPKPAAIFRQPSPEEAEIILRRAELAILRNALAAQEAGLAHRRAQLNSFEGRYIRQVGVLYIQLDEWEERIAELNAPPSFTQQPGPSTLAPEPPPAELEPSQAFLNLKTLFRQVAKRIHPDFARDLLDEQHRTRLMAQANDAFRRDDAAILHRMLHGYDPSTDSGDTHGTAAELARTLDQIEQSKQDIAIILAEIEALSQSEMADLEQRTLLAATKGRDLLAELAARVKGSIGIAMRRYELDLGRARRKEAAFNPDPLLSAEIPESAKTYKPTTATGRRR